MGKRGNNEGSIRQRKDGKWEARASIGYSDDGKLKRVSKYFKTRKEAAAWLAEVQIRQQNGTFVEPDKILFGEWAQRWVKVYAKPKIRPNSYANYVDALRVHILPALGKIPLQKLTTDTIQEFYNQKAEAGRADGKPGGLSPRIGASVPPASQSVSSPPPESVSRRLGSGGTRDDARWG